MLHTHSARVVVGRLRISLWYEHFYLVSMSESKASIKCHWTKWRIHAEIYFILWSDYWFLLNFTSNSLAKREKFTLWIAEVQFKQKRWFNCGFINEFKFELPSRIKRITYWSTVFNLGEIHEKKFNQMIFETERVLTLWNSKNENCSINCIIFWEFIDIFPTVRFCLWSVTVSNLIVVEYLIGFQLLRWDEKSYCLKERFRFDRISVSNW